MLTNYLFNSMNYIDYWRKSILLNYNINEFFVFIFRTNSFVNIFSCSFLFIKCYLNLKLLDNKP